MDKIVAKIYKTLKKEAEAKAQSGNIKGAVERYIEIYAEIYKSLLCRKDDMKLALAVANRIIELDSKRAEGYCRRGFVYYSMKEFSKAIENCNKAISLDPKYAAAYSRRGLSYYGLGKYDKAISDCSKAILLDSKLSEAYNNRGLAYWEKKEFEKAFDDFNKAIDFDPKNAVAMGNRGDRYRILGKFNKAIDDFNKAIQLNPVFANAYNARGLTYYQMGKSEKALSDLDKAIELDPNDTDAYINRGVAHHSLKNYQAAIDDCTKAIELDPKMANAYYNRGNAKSDERDFKGAIEDYNKIIEIDPKKSWAHFYRGVAKHNSGDLKGAIEDYDKAIKLDPKMAMAYNNRSAARIGLENVVGAREDAEKAIELDPKLALAYYNRGVIKINDDNLDDAIEDWNKAIEIDPKMAMAYYNRGLAKRKSDNLKGAIEDWNKAIEIDPKMANAYNNRGYTKYRLGKSEDGLADCSKAIELDPNLIYAHNSKIEIMHKMGRTKDCELEFITTLRIIDNLIAKDKTDIGKYVQKTETYLYAGKENEAKQVIGEVLAYIRSDFVKYKDWELSELLDASFLSNDESLIDRVNTAITPRLSNKYYRNKIAKLYDDYRSRSLVEKEDFRKKLNEKMRDAKMEGVILRKLDTMQEKYDATMSGIGMELKQTREQISTAEKNITSEVIKNRGLLLKLNTEISEIKSKKFGLEKTIVKILELQEKYAKDAILKNQHRYAEIKRKLSETFTFAAKVDERVLESLATAEYLLELVRGTKEMDYSGIIIEYCKSLEIAEHDLCVRIAPDLKSMIELTCSATIKEKMVLDNNLKKKVPRYEIQDVRDYTKYMPMQKATVNSRAEDGRELSLFHEAKLKSTLADFLTFGPSGDICKYNTLLFFYWMNRGLNKKELERKTGIIEGIYWLYDARNGSAHRSKKTLKDAQHIRGKILGDEGKPETGLIYRVLRELK